MGRGGAVINPGGLPAIGNVQELREKNNELAALQVVGEKKTSRRLLTVLLACQAQLLQKGRKSTEGQALAAKAGALDDRIEQVLHAGKAFSHRTPTLTCVVIVRR